MVLQSFRFIVSWFAKAFSGKLGVKRMGSQFQETSIEELQFQYRYTDRRMTSHFENPFVLHLKQVLHHHFFKEF